MLQPVVDELVEEPVAASVPAGPSGSWSMLALHQTHHSRVPTVCQGVGEV